MKNKLIHILQSLDIIYDEKRVKLKNAGMSGYYIDVKKALGDPLALRLMAQELYKGFDRSATCVAAAGYGGISLATVISEKYRLHLVLVRDSEKKHGKGGFIDGYFPNKNDLIEVVDDVSSTGGSLRGYCYFNVTFI